MNANKIHYLNVEMLNNAKGKLNSNLSNYELNETKKSIIELEQKVVNHKPATNLMIAEYRKQLSEIKNRKLAEITYSGTISYIEISKHE